MSSSSSFDPVLPGSGLARSLTSTVLATELPAIANHSIRTFLFARLLGEHLDAAPGRDYDEQLLFAACLLHDIGLTSAADGRQRFEVDGADHAAQILRGHGMPVPDVDAVWDAIALHTSGGIAERRSLLCRLTRGGVGLDLGLGAEFVVAEQAAAIHAAYPRLDMERALEAYS
jgi:hypothetical protein